MALELPMMFEGLKRSFSSSVRRRFSSMSWRRSSWAFWRSFTAWEIMEPMIDSRRTT
jgi:hypothetical protein